MTLLLVLGLMALAAGAGLVAGAPGRGPLLQRLAIAVAVVAMAGGVYALVGRPDLPQSSPARPRPPQAAPSLATITAMLEARTRQTPKDVEAWRVLAFAYERGGRYADAAAAYAAAEPLAPTLADLPSGRGEALVEAAGGKVTPEARAAFEKARALAPADPRARFYLALADFQAGRRDKAKAEWDALLASAPPDASWLPGVKALIARFEGGEAKAGLETAAPAR